MGWHSFGNPNKYKPEEYLKEHDFGRGHKEIYACQFKEDGRQKEASNWFRVNPHRLHLGIGDWSWAMMKDFWHYRYCPDIDMWNGVINSHFTPNGNAWCTDRMSSANGHDFSQYHQSGMRGWNCIFHTLRALMPMMPAIGMPNNKHTTTIVFENAQSALFSNVHLDSTVYYVSCVGKAKLQPEKSQNYFVLTPKKINWLFLSLYVRIFREPYSKVNLGLCWRSGIAYFRRNSAASATAIGRISGRMVLLSTSLIVPIRVPKNWNVRVLSQYLLAIQSAVVFRRRKQVWR